MNIRKLFNVPSKRQKKLLAADKEKILEFCSNIASKERDDMKKNQEIHDNVCPNCSTKKNSNNIVDKIRETRGEGDVDGNFIWGFGSVDGDMSIKTYAVNHCNVCGNEWKKFKTELTFNTDILRVGLNYLADIIKNPVYEKTFNWQVEAIKIFDNCYAENIYSFCKEEKYSLWSSTESQLKLFRLRKYFKSVYDPENKKKIEKL